MVPLDSYGRQSPSRMDVWTVWLNAAPDVNRAFRALLSPEETARADRFAFEHLKRSYEVSHGALRLLLAHYLNCAARELVFRSSKRGKPELCGDCRATFNMSHSGGLAAYALTLDCEVGVDIEEVRDIPDLEEIAEHHFCRAEASHLRLVTRGRLQQIAFFRCWTRKEAYIKAVGDGLYLSLDQFQVTLLPRHPARLVQIDNDTNAALEWTLEDLELAPGYVGAICYRASTRQIALHPPQQPRDLLSAVGAAAW